MKPGQELTGGYELIETIGKGSFSEIFSARAPNGQSVVAVKVQGPDFDSKVLRWEASVLQALSDTNVAPKLHGTGHIERRDYIIMDLLSGEDMASVRNRARAGNPAGLVPLTLVVHLVSEMVRCLRAMHSKGYVHRDVKPSNFVRKDVHSTEFLIIDFGLAKQYRDKDGNIVRARKDVEFRGTTIYASPFVHDGLDQCPRDDLCSIVHVFFDMVCGKLPWGEAARLKDKGAVASSKRHCYADFDQFINCQHAQVAAAEAQKGLTDAESSNFPLRARLAVRRVLEHLKGLDYDSLPDYDLMLQEFSNCLEDTGEVGAADLGFQAGGFSWRSERPHRPSFSLPPAAVPGPIATLAAVPTMAPPVDPSALQISHLTTRVQALKAPASTPEDLYAKALRFQNLSKELCKLPDDKLDLRLLGEFSSVLQQHQHFFGLALGDSEEKWVEFTKLAEATSAFYALSARARKRRRELLELETA